jgi:hypothetical protein
MGNSGDQKYKEQYPGFAVFAAKKILPVALLAVLGLWVLLQVLDLMDMPEPIDVKGDERAAIHSPSGVIKEKPEGTAETNIAQPAAPAREVVQEPADALPPARQDSTTDVKPHGVELSVRSALEKIPENRQPSAEPSKPAESESRAQVRPAQKEDDSGHRPFQLTQVDQPKGVAFIGALVEPLHYEINERFWGWRPNDIIDLTDNVNNLQLGVLEFTRRTAIVLAERLSRTGATAAFDPNLQQAMNWFMIKAEQYWLPSPEDKYNEGLKNLRTYKSRLEKGTATFYTRNDNLIPLLSVYEDLLGGCEENLVKVTEENGEPVSYFRADDYFYYAKGVATAMLPVLEAISIDFASTLENRRGTDVLRHAIEALHHAIEIEPIIITNSSLDGILANHRANLAAPISHARFYLGVLIKTLGT